MMASMSELRIGVLGRIVEGDGRGRVVEVIEDIADAGGWLIFTYADVGRSDPDLARWAYSWDLEDVDSYIEARKIEWLAPAGESARERSPNAEVAGVARAWIEYQRASDKGDEEHADVWMWGSDRITALLRAGEIDRAWLVIAGICAQVDADDLDLALMIGAGPLEDFIVTFRDKAMDLIEPALQENKTLLTALAGAWDQGSGMRGRIGDALAEHGQERL